MSYTENENRKRTMVIAIIILLLVIIAAGVMYFTGKGDAEPTQDTETRADSVVATVPDTLTADTLAAVKEVVEPQPAKADSAKDAPAKKKPAKKSKNVINLKGKYKCVETDYHFWDIVKVEFRKDKTILTKVCRPKVTDTYICSDRSEYIADAKTGQRFHILESSLDFKRTPQYTLTTTNSVTFTEVYPALPASVKTIDISNGGGKFYAKGLKIR